MNLKAEEHATIILSKKSEVYAKMQVIREGSDITLVGWGAQLSTMEQACIEAAKVNTSFY